MRLLVLISSGVIRNTSKNEFYQGVIQALKSIAAAGNTIFLVSNKKRPDWLDDSLSFIKFQPCHSRQDGKIVKGLIEANKKNELLHSEVVIFGSSDEDFMMAANSRTLLVRCEWAALGEKIKNYGVPWSDPRTLPELATFLENKKPWYFKSEQDFLDVYSMTDAGTKFETNLNIKRLTERLQACLKNGRPELKNGFILHFLSSIYATNIFGSVDLWSVYPSSASTNNHTENMVEFCALARALYKKKHKEPLFLRHTPSIKRHIVGGDRNDPRSQIETIHLNPFYNGKLAGKTVVVLDDYLNRGVSFGVSAAFLKKAGAHKVIGVSMGKFGDASLRYNIDISSDAFAPVLSWREGKRSKMIGNTTIDAKLEFVKKFRVGL